MNCPKCKGSMESVAHEGVTVDRCTACGGIWFDALEAEDLIASERGGSVDTGSPIKGWQMNRIRDIHCPRCGEQMQTVSDTKESLVKFEVCTKCHGYFMDAGEFRDLTHENIPEKLTEKMIEKAKEFVDVFKLMHVVEEEAKDKKQEK
ncbi:MAG: zf-TFIIB domain-containing protein [Phycisphaerae bacterium]|nr:zf-TFIIB domain-containing protein [Phycisphaerae bacterium]